MVLLCSWARHITLTVPLSTQVYKCVPVNLMLGVTLRWTRILLQRGIKIFLVSWCYWNRYKLRPDDPSASLDLPQVDLMNCKIRLPNCKIRLPKLSLLCLTMQASSTDAFKALGWPTLFQERLVHRNITTFKYIHGLVDHNFNFFWETQTSIVITLEGGTISVFLSLKGITESRDFFIIALRNGTL